MTNLKFRAAILFCIKDQSLGEGIVIIQKRLCLQLIGVTSVFAQADFLEVSLKKKCSDQQRQNLSALTKLKNSLGTNLSKFSTLIFEQTVVCLTLRQLFEPNTKPTFFPHRQILYDSQDTELPCFVIVHGLTFIMTSSVSFPHILHT